MNFRDSEIYLLSLGNEVSAMKLGLENIRKLLAAFDNPQNNYKKVQVAGTNGKGSICAFLDSICFRAGIKTGLYTSPHLISITERIRIGGQDISEIEFARLATRVRETAETLVAKGELESVPTFFEQVTAIALLAFAEAKVDLAILETGLGGRLDATTAANAEIVAITPIDIDHQEYLGETLAEIAAEKAAIIRPHSQVVISEQNEEVMTVLLADRANVGETPALAQMVLSEPGVVTTGFLREETHSLPVVFPPLSPISFRTPKHQYENVYVGLRGRHQIENAKAAILLAEILQEHFRISTENIVDGLENARHPGRLEYRDQFLFDGAHNVSGAKALREYLDEFVHQPITLIFGSMKGKDIEHIAEILFPKADTLILTQPENSRAMTAKELSKFVAPAGDAARIIQTATVAEAIEQAKGITPADRIILVTGSLYLVGEAQKHLAVGGQQ